MSDPVIRCDFFAIPARRMVSVCNELLCAVFCREFELVLSSYGHVYKLIVRPCFRRSKLESGFSTGQVFGPPLTRCVACFFVYVDVTGEVWSREGSFLAASFGFRVEQFDLVLNVV